MLKLIVCIDNKNGIGKNNTIPWKNKEELLHFKKITENNIVVMGTKTYYSIGKPLANRTNIVLSKNTNLKIDNVQVINNYEEILKLAEHQDVFVIGGSEIYKLFEFYYDELIISQINGNYECDKYFNLNLKFYQLSKTEKFETFSVNYYKSLKNKIMFGNLCSNHLQKKLIDLKNDLVKKYKKIPTLTIVQVGDIFASNVYIKNKMKLAETLGINCNLLKLSEMISEKELIKEINKLNKNSRVNGILIQSPLPKHINENLIFSTINPDKDVDCFNPINIGKMWINPNQENLLLPCTPLGIIELLEYNKINLESKKVVVVGRSNIVSKPLVSLLLANNATVSICHSKTKNLKEFTQSADIVISAIGQANYFDASYFNDNAIVIDVGINRDKNNKLSGDVDFLDVINKVQKITPVPYGIGPMTLISLFKNLLICCLKQQK